MAKLKLINIALSSILTITAAGAVHAVEAPDAETLTGRLYGGLHATVINPSSKREIAKETPGVLPIEYSFIENSFGGGLEIGYRFLPKFEARLSHTFLDLKAKDRNFKKNTDGSLSAIDVLYFPTGKNFYALAGADYIDMTRKDWSLDLGAGYRHYLSEKSAVYLEGKGHYQYDDNIKDYSARLGFVYFFGESPKAMPKRQAAVEPAESVAIAPAAAASAAVVAAAPVDSDNDGVIDSKDNCADTPATHVVDEFGCTTYYEDEVSAQLLVGFASNSAEVAQEYYAEIERAAEFLKTYPETTLELEGHTSSVGNAEYNKSLSQKRADAVMQVLINEYSIDASRLSATGYGEEQLLDEANTKEAHAKNRRIQARVTFSQKMPVLK